RSHVAITRRRAGDRAPRRLDRDAVVVKPVRSVAPAAPVHAREAAVMQASGDGSQGRDLQTPGSWLQAPGSRLPCNKRLVPVDLQIRPNPHTMIPSGENARDIDHHRLVFPRWEADAAARYPVAPRVLHLEHGRLGAHFVL